MILVNETVISKKLFFDLFGTSKFPVLYPLVRPGKKNLLLVGGRGGRENVDGELK